MSDGGDSERARPTRALTVVWGICFALAFASGGVFAQGVLRDTRPGGVELAVDLGVPSGWREGSFEAGPEPHVVYLTTVNHDLERVGAPLEAALEVRLVGPDGRVAFALAHPPDPLAHRMPDNMVWTELAHLERLAPGRWTLSARVLRGDPHFAGVRSRVLVRPMRPSAGMGGLIHYAMMLPAAAFGALTLGLAIGIALRGGSRLPLLLSCLAPVLAWACFLA